MTLATRSETTENAVLAEHLPLEAAHSDEIEVESTAEAHASTLSAKRSRGKTMVADHTARPSSRTTGKTPSMRPMCDGWATPSDVEKFADDIPMPDVLPAKRLKFNADAQRAQN
jgi:hypothetical protein